MRADQSTWLKGRCVPVGTALLCAVTIVSAQGQDSAPMAQALERAERLNVRLLPGPQPTAQWLDGDRLGYSADGKGPWAVLDATTGQVHSQTRETIPAPGPTQNTPPAWMLRPENPDLVVTDTDGVTRLRLSGAPRYGWGAPPQGGNRERRIFVAVRTDQRAVHTLPIVDYSSAVERVSQAPYPKSGTPLPVMELHLVDPAAAHTRPVQLDTRDAYVWFLGWRERVSEALVLRLSRDSRRLELFAIDDTTGATRLLAHDERPETFVAGLEFSTGDWQWQVTPLPDDSGFLWMSERDGWRHVYHYGFDGALKTKVTSGAFPVHRVVRVDTARQQAWVIGSADTSRPYDRHVYRVALDGTGFTALTTAPGQHQPVFSSSGRFFIDTYSNLTEPHTVELRRDDGTLVKRLGQASPVQGYTPPEPFRVKAADGTTDLYGVLYRPTDFDATRRYPVVDYIYAGPFLAVHQTTYLPSSAMQRTAASLAEMGVVVALLDARGTPGRSKVFQDANYGRIGQDVEIPDHVAALKELARSRPYMDMTRVGIAGHSWGGYYALRGMLTAPDFFTVGYAGAPGDLTEAASINEPNMGLMASNQAGYDAGSNLGRAAALRGKLKIMHGTSDVMAPLSTTMRMAQALIEANKTFDLLIMPGQPHGPAGAAGRYYRDDVRRFMALHLLPNK